MSNVISLDRTKKPGKEKKKDEAGMNFDEIMRINAENEARLKKDRLKANKGVTRAYRLKK